ncbi:MAG TPA: polysaccharide biosynthesis/export family protein [Candidatus Wunengus sp. YC63]|uniref:polysaccharide biosynthesis/export family protein n=1 Tax=unclassified Candidatus Wunengus TaxID=3367695 RepID=UPI004028B095
MNKNNYYLLSILPLLISLLIGCASTGVKTQEEKTTAAEHHVNDEKINKVRISEFILGVGDTIEISVYRQEDLQKTLKINNSGRIMLPLIGDVQAAGVGIFKLRDEIKERLSKYLIDPQVLVSISTVQSQKIMVLGEVNTPGVFTLDTDIDILEAISKAGGMTKDAKMANVLIIRRGQGKPEVTSLNLKKVFKGGDISQNLILQNGDIVYLPRVTIANVSRFFSQLSEILSPFVMFETGAVLWPAVKDVMQGKDLTTSPVSIPTR